MTRRVSDLAREVEQFQSVLLFERELLRQRTWDEQQAQRYLTDIRARLGKIATSARTVVDGLD